jgi:outer membrane protein assembly factor BamB
MKKYLLIILLFTMLPLVAADWPVYRGDNQRRAWSPDVLPQKLSQAWSYQSARKPVTAWPGAGTRMNSDACFQPVSVGDKVFFGSSADHTLYALQTSTGKEAWKFQAGGPIRFAPLCWEDKVYFISDDAHLYCLDQKTGELLWKFNGVPEASYLPGNRQIVSRWPARGAPIVEKGILYFTVGIWPSEGIFVYALDAAKGQVKWCNDNSGGLRLKQPHGGAVSDSGITGQGYLTICNDKLLVPCGRSIPAILNKKTGVYEEFLLQSNRALGGGELAVLPKLNAFISNTRLLKIPGKDTKVFNGAHAVITNEGVLSVKKNTLTLDHIGDKSTKDRKGKEQISLSVLKSEQLGKLKVTPTIMVACANSVIIGSENKVSIFDIAQKKVTQSFTIKGTPLALAIANSQIIVSTDAGQILLFSASGKNIKNVQKKVVAKSSPVVQKEVKILLQQATIKQGYALLNGVSTDMIESFLVESPYSLVVLENDPQKFQLLQKTLGQLELYGERLQLIKGKLSKSPFASRLFSLIVDADSKGNKPEINRLLHPYGGAYFKGSSLTKSFVLESVPGAGDWTHQYHDPANTAASQDTIVKGPLAIRWFSDFDFFMPNRHGQAPAPLYLNGRMFIEGLDGLICVDAFNGRKLWTRSFPKLLKHLDQDHLIGTSVRGGNMVISDKYLFLVIADKCHKIDPLTGKDLGVIQLPEKGEWGYLAYQNGILYGSIVDKSYLVRWGYKKGDMNGIFSESKSLFAMNPKDGKLLWSYKAKDSIRHNTICLSGSTLYFIDRPLPEGESYSLALAKRRGKSAQVIHKTGLLIALDSKSGKKKWQNDKEIYGTLLCADSKSQTLLMTYSFTSWKLPSEVGGKMTAFDMFSGKLRWQQKTVKGGYSKRSRPVLLGKRIFMEPAVYDISTGKVLDMKINRTYGCGLNTACKNLLLLRSGTLGFIDLNNPKRIENYGGIRSGCWINVIPVGGMILMPDYTERCSCSYLIKSSIALSERAGVPLIKATALANNKVKVSISAKHEIRYTLDGLPPSIDSPLYQEPLILDKKTLLKAKCFEHGLAPGETRISGAH